ncbi:MAG: RNA-binding transcriptional accessory protein [Clostridia bacterium]|nr:RNA-binding transcriptional accessory protein [Clostridia bacterium]
MDIISAIAAELSIKESQAKSAVELLDEGNTVPFIARYRKEVTGNLSDEVLRKLEERLNALRALESRKEDVKRLLTEQGNLTAEIEAALGKALTVAEVDDIYRPFRPKRRTRAIIAREKGLDPLAVFIEEQGKVSPIEEANKYISEDKDVSSAEEALKGAIDIIAERISDNAEYRRWIRNVSWRKANIVTKARTEEDSVYRLYYDHAELIGKIPSHRILAINRGEAEGMLSVKVTVDTAEIMSYLRSKVIKNPSSPCVPYLEEAVQDSYDRLIAPSIATELRNMATESGEERAIEVFGHNLKALIMASPLKGKVVMGFDPAYRTGCKIAVVDAKGDVLATTVVYPTPPQKKTIDAKRVLKELIYKHKVDVISIGNGTASKESEIFVAELISELDRKVSYIVVSEAGASVYSASPLGTKEFPEFDVSLRSAVSIARRLQDPMAELVKIEPKAIGVGQYQHDLNPKKLDQSLAGIVESCVSSVGVDINTASPSLLSYIAGINSKTAQNICDYRSENGMFRSRKEIKKVKGIGEKAYVQCSGFLRVPESAELLDNTAVHPESYTSAKALIKAIGLSEKEIIADSSVLSAALEGKDRSALAKELELGLPTLNDIIGELMKPGRDIRDDLPKPILKSEVMDISDLKEGMELVGTVRNVADFGAFVDIGVHQDGLIHISRLAKHFVKKASDEVSVGDILTVRVIEVDVKKKRIALERVF